MIAGTTPIHKFNVGFDVVAIKEVEICYAQKNEVKVRKTKKDCELKDSYVVVKLSQNDTLSFDDSFSFVEIQLRILTTDDSVLGSKIIKTSLVNCLSEEVLR